MIFMTALILFFVVYIALIATLCGKDVLEARRLAKQDKQIDDEMRKYQEEKKAEEDAKAKLMDEGFENIMSYEVNGKNGFEETI